MWPVMAFKHFFLNSKPLDLSCNGRLLQSDFFKLDSNIFIELLTRNWFDRSIRLNKIPYARHHKPLLITSRSWIQAIHKDRIFLKNLLKNKEMVFENGVKNIQATAYNGARTVFVPSKSFSHTYFKQLFILIFQSTK